MPNEEDRLPEGFEVISIDEGREYKVQKICISQCWEYSRKAVVLFIFNSLTEGRPSVWRLSETGVDADVRSNLRVIRRQGQHRGTLRHPQRESQGRHPDPQRGATDVRKGRHGELPQCFCKRLEVRKVTRNMVYKGQAIRDDIKILRDGTGHLISIFQVDWDSNTIRVIMCSINFNK